MTVAPFALPVEDVSPETPGGRRRVVALSFPATTSTRVVAGMVDGLCGWSFLETTGSAAATVEVYDGQDATGELLTVISLSSGQSTRDWVDRQGLEVRIGMFLRVTAGSVRGALWVRLPDGT